MYYAFEAFLIFGFIVAPIAILLSPLVTRNDKVKDFVMPILMGAFCVLWAILRFRFSKPKLQ